MSQEPILSVVVVSRNDDHGGNLLQRMQLFVTGWLEQARRHNLSSELIIVEWNPPPDRPRLAQALKWPKDTGPCTVRIIEVQPEIHHRFKQSDRLPLFQMIGKNVGIRRARGRFILATNIDILFSDELMDFFASGQMTTGYMYRIDRYDIPSDIPGDVSITKQLDYCRDNIIRINTRGKTIILGKPEETFSILQAFKKRVQALRNTQDVARLGKDIFLYPYNRVAQAIKPIIYGSPLHTNACGDFTLMAREHWLALRGNAEFETFSLHLDGLMCAVAHYGGAKELVLEEPMPIYHIEHAPGSGWAPGMGAKLLDERLRAAGIQQLTHRDYLKYLRQIRWKHSSTVFNDENWGLGQESLKESVIVSPN
ncbi:MAG: hypothetical protein HY529_00865 [Chloroflexi bacterium]|nr:hypothetical protein [Chloroflexota bacterium]